MRQLFIFGLGFSAQEIVKQAHGDFGRICGTSRSAEKAKSFSDFGVEGFLFDGESVDGKLREALFETTHLVISIAPGDIDPVLKAIGADLGTVCPKLEWIGYLSTVGVYGDHDGAWVTENTEPRPVSKRSIERIRAERQWQEAGLGLDVPIAIFRLSGIYGPGRNGIVNMKKGKARRLVKPDQVFNRIHREDIGQAVMLAMRNKVDGIFNITDDEPAPPQDVVTYIHELAGVEPPPEIDFETAELSPMTRSFYGENKRVSNQRSKEVLGMTYHWPNYRVAFDRMWRDGSWE